MAYGYHLEAEYESGYIHRETEEDMSPYTEGKNIFNDILEHRPEKAHGKLIRFSLVGSTHTYSVDFSNLPENARPIYFREMQHVRDLNTGDSTTTMKMQTFGYQYNDEEGRNHKEIQVIDE